MPDVRTLALGCAVGLTPGLTSAAPEPDTQADVSAGADAVIDAEVPYARPKKRASKRTDVRWMSRWAPERNQVELTGSFGLFAVPGDHELFFARIDRPQQGFLPLRRVAPQVGARVGYFPLRFLGLEAEGTIGRTRTKADALPVRLFGARGQLVGQVPYTVTPFALVGVGALGITSPQSTLGSDTDTVWHVGIGAKLYLSRWWHLRLDFRDYITPRRGTDVGATNWLETTLSVGLTFGRARSRPTPTEPPAAPPTQALPDRDADGWFDDDDACPDEAGNDPDGCPPLPDRDDDGYPDDEDVCPDEAGIDPDGCPDLDPDKDGVLRDVDACPEDPETHNGFEDADGCPDQMPEEVAKFEGTLVGVTFALNRAQLTPSSADTLQAAVAVLTKFPGIRVEIIGHTDSIGTREYNMKLSQVRADAVTEFLVSNGVDAGRIETRGAGPDEPMDTNKTSVGRSNNRRIEFRVLN